MVPASHRSLAPRRVAAHSAAPDAGRLPARGARRVHADALRDDSPIIPQPLIDKIPVVIGVHMPLEFREKVYEEKRERRRRIFHRARQGAVGRVHAHRHGHVQRAWSRWIHRQAAAATDKEIRGVLQPTLDDYAFVTPADSGTPLYAASLRYTVRLYSPTGQLGESWSFTGYGTQAASSVPGQGR